MNQNLSPFAKALVALMLEHEKTTSLLQLWDDLRRAMLTIIVLSSHDAHVDPKEELEKAIEDLRKALPHIIEADMKIIAKRFS